MKREKLKLLMGVIILAAAYLISREGARVVSQMKTEAVMEGEFCVVIDAGHGGSDPGKVSASGTKEKTVNLQIANRLKELLEAQDVTVYMTRSDDDGLYSKGSNSAKAEDLKKRCEIIHEKQPNCVVSIHQNSYHESNVKGAQTFYYATSLEGKLLAERIQASLIERLDPDNHRMAKNNTSYYMLKKTDAPITIVECGFLSNPEEAELLIQPDYQEKVAWAVHMGVMNYLYEQSENGKNAESP